MIDLGRAFDPVTAPPWPGMSAQDSIIWVRAQEIITQPDDRIYYNVRIGPARESAEYLPLQIRTMWSQINAKRVDLVIERGDTWIIVEVRHLATSAVLGRLLMYERLWHMDRPEAKLELALITDWLDPDLMPMLSGSNIAWMVI